MILSLNEVRVIFGGTLMSLGCKVGTKRVSKVFFGNLSALYGNTAQVPQSVYERIISFVRLSPPEGLQIGKEDLYKLFVGCFYLNDGLTVGNGSRELPTILNIEQLRILLGCYLCGALRDGEFREASELFRNTGSAYGFLMSLVEKSVEKSLLHPGRETDIRIPDEVKAYLEDAAASLEPLQGAEDVFRLYMELFFGKRVLGCMGRIASPEIRKAYGTVLANSDIQGLAAQEIRKLVEDAIGGGPVRPEDLDALESYIEHPMFYELDEYRMYIIALYEDADIIYALKAKEDPVTLEVEEIQDLVGAYLYCSPDIMMDREWEADSGYSEPRKKLDYMVHLAAEAFLKGGEDMGSQDGDKGKVHVVLSDRARKLLEYVDENTGIFEKYLYQPCKLFVKAFFCLL